MKKTLLTLAFLLGAVSAPAQVIYEPCTGPDCNRAQCLSLAACGTGAPLDTSPDGCIEKLGQDLISTGLPCGSGGGGSGAQCTLPFAADEILVSTSSTNASWLDVPDCGAGALAFSIGPPPTFGCVAIPGVLPNPPPIFVKQAADRQAKTNSTDLNDPQNVTDLFVPVNNGGVLYRVTANLYVNSKGTSTIPALKTHFSLDDPGVGPQSLITCGSFDNNSSNNAEIDFADPATGSVANGSLTIRAGAAVNPTKVECNGWFITGTGLTNTSTIFRFQFAQANASPLAVTLLKGSSMTVTLVP